jgi:hypothetical protein
VCVRWMGDSAAFCRARVFGYFWNLAGLEWIYCSDIRFLMIIWEV